MEILEAIPWGKVDIRTLTVEIHHFSNSDQEKIIELMRKNGYTMEEYIEHQDVFFVSERQLLED